MKGHLWIEAMVVGMDSDEEPQVNGIFVSSHGGVHGHSTSESWTRELFI